MSEDSRLFYEKKKKKKRHYVSLIFGYINTPLYFLAIYMDFPTV